jgi:hypothetical protein
MECVVVEAIRLAPVVVELETVMQAVFWVVVTQTGAKAIETQASQLG